MPHFLKHGALLKNICSLGMHYFYLYWKFFFVASNLDMKLIPHVLGIYGVVKKLIGPAHITQKISLREHLVDESFIEAQLKYSSSTWLLVSQNLNDKISRLHERTKEIIY